MALREVLAELDVRVRGTEGLDRASAGMDRFVRSVRTAPTQQLQQNVQRVGTNMRSSASAAGGLASAFTGVSGALVAVGAAAIAVQHALSGVTELLREVIEVGDEIGDTAERLGVSAEALQRWRYVAERSGVSTEELDRSLGILNRNTAAAARGGGSAAGAFRRLDVALRGANGELRPTEEVLFDTLRALSRIENPTERAGVAMQIFGRQGAGMAVIASRGEEAIAALVERQRELGGGFSDDVVDGAGEADDALIDFRLAMTSLKGALAADVLPALTSVITGVASFIGGFVELIRTTSIVETALGAIAVVLALLAWVLLPASLPIILATVALVALVIAIEDVVTAFRGGESVFGTLVDRLLEAMGVTLTFEDILESFGAAWDEALAEASEGVTELLESLVRLQRATGIDLGLRGAVTARASGHVDAPPPAIVERRRGRARHARATGEVSMPTTIHIQAANDPAAVGREVDRHLRRRLREAAAAQPVAPEEDD